MLIFIALFILNITEDQNYFDLFFETVSAFGTVGLSRGITPFLSEYGKMIIILVMFFGRIGMFTIALTVSEKIITHNYRFPNTTLMI